MAPEVNRNRNIGEKGANMRANYYRQYLRSMQWAEQGADGFGDLSQLALPAYEERTARLVAAAVPWPGGSMEEAPLTPGHVRHLTRLTLTPQTASRAVPKSLCRGVPGRCTCCPTWWRSTPTW